MSLLSYRLGSSSLFVRTNEDSVEPNVDLAIERAKEFAPSNQLLEKLDQI